MKSGMVIKRLFSWDYERAKDRETEMKAQISERSAICVPTDHNWSHNRFSLEVYTAVHRQPESFTGGVYEEIQAYEREGVSEMEAYAVAADMLREGFPIRIQYDASSKYLIIFRFRPKDAPWNIRS